MKNILAVALLTAIGCNAQAVVFSTTELAFGADGSAVRADTGTSDVKNTLYIDDGQGSNSVDVDAFDVLDGLNDFSNVSGVSSGNDAVLNPNSMLHDRGQLGFSVSLGSTGAAGTDVNAQTGQNAADIYRYMGLSGVHSLMVNESDLGLGATDDLDAMDAFGINYDEKTSWANVNNPDIYLALEGSEDIWVTNADGALPTLYKDGVNEIGLHSADDIDALLLNVSQGWAAFSLSSTSYNVIVGPYSGADVLFTTFDGSFGTLFTAAELGLNASDNIDALESTIPLPSSLLLALSALGLLARRRQLG